MGVKVKNESHLMMEKSHISSKSLFHFTDSLSTLKKILKSQYFLVKECEEHHWGGYKFTVPMACFCDIPLSKISSHTDQYGCYGIGMSSEWANRMKLCSVMYVRSESDLSKWVTKTLREITTHHDCTISKEALYLLSRIKKYKGKVPNKKGNMADKEKCVTFYDEREWRFVPEKLTIQEIQIGKKDDQFVIQERGKLPFELSDIEYIIVKSESDLKDIIKAINKLEEDEETLDMQKSKILTVQQIEQDF